MSDIVVRDIEEAVLAALGRLAQEHGRTLEHEVREILTTAARQSPPSTGGLGTRIASLFAQEGFDWEIAEVRGFPARPAEFDP